MTFVPFSYKPAGGLAERGSEKEFVPPAYETETKTSVSHVAHNVHASKFELNPMVKQAIGVEEEENARKEERIRIELERRWEILKAKAEVEGFQAGLEAGKKEAYLAEKPRIDDQLSRLDSIISELTSMRTRIFEANEKFLLDIIAQVARMIVLKEVSVDEDYLKRVVTQILAQTGAREDIRILISEQDRKLIDALQMFLEKEFGKLNNTVIETSPAIAPHGCKVETRFGVVDASLQAQIQSIVETLRNA